MKRAAVIDVGTNSIKLLVADLAGGALAERLQLTEVTRLGEGLGRTGRLGEAAMARALGHLGDFAARARAEGVEDLAAIGTQALRRADNSAEFLSRAEACAGLTVVVISGEEEAGYSHRGAVSALSPGDGMLCVFDVGGGSTEFSFGRGGTSERRLSLELGCRPLVEGLVEDPPSPAALAALRAEAARRLEALPVPDGPPPLVVGVGGTVTTLVAVRLALEHYDAILVQGQRVERAELEAQIARYAGCTLAERRRIPGLRPERADVILAGAAIVAAVCDRLGTSSLLASDRGLRQGFLLARHGAA